MASTLEDRLAEVDRLKAKLDALRPLDPEVEGRVLQKIRLWWTYHSNAIEGNRLTQGETEMLLLEGITAKGKPLKDHLDLKGHSNAINYLLAFVREDEPLTEAAIREFHKVLLGESYQVPALTPDGQPTQKTVAIGEYKTQPNHVRTVTGEMHYYATPEETPAKMAALIQQLRDALAEGKTHPVEIIAIFHHEFTAIHPFDDGNGRMARLLSNLLLMQHGYPPIVIRKEERDEYLQALREADQGNARALVLLTADHVAASLDLYLRAAAGEEISEPTDLEKRIALLKMALEPVEEPQPLTWEVQNSIIKESFDPLVREINRLLSKVSDLFYDAKVHFDGSCHTEVYSGVELNRQILDLFSTMGIPIPQMVPQIPYIIDFIRIRYELNGFKKARFDAFNGILSLELRFDPLKYSVEVKGKPPVLIEHFYQEPLTKEEVSMIAEKVVGSLLDFIQAKTGLKV